MIAPALLISLLSLPADPQGSPTGERKNRSVKDGSETIEFNVVPERSRAELDAARNEAPLARVPLPAARWNALPVSRGRLATAGSTWRVVMLGDSIVNDLWRSDVAGLLQARHPATTVELTAVVSGNKGCAWYAQDDRIARHVTPLQPDLLIIVGMSHGGDLDAVRAVIRAVRVDRAVDVLLCTRPFVELDPNDDAQWTKVRANAPDAWPVQLAGLARETGAAFLDLQLSWGDAVRASGRPIDSFRRDAIHANACGEALLGQIVSDWLAPGRASGKHEIQVGGRKRAFLLDVPASLASGAALVLAFHGYGDSAEGIREYSGLLPIGEKHGFVLAWPQGTRDQYGNRFFNAGYAFHKSDVDDLAFARELAAQLVRELALDPQAVFATGMSNGGDISYRIGWQPEPFVRAIAPVAGTMMSDWLKTSPNARIPVLAVHGTKDSVTLWAGDTANRDGWGCYLGTEAVVEHWVEALKLEHSSTEPLPDRDPADGSRVQLRRWWTDADTTEFRLYQIDGGGHDWPGAAGNRDFDTAAEIWRFFDSHRLPR